MAFVYSPLPHNSLLCVFPRPWCPDTLGSRNLNSTRSVLDHSLPSLASVLLFLPLHLLSLSADPSHPPWITSPPSWLETALPPAECPWDTTSATLLSINPAPSFLSSTSRAWKQLEEFTHCCELKFLQLHGFSVNWASEAAPAPPPCFHHSRVRPSPHSSYSDINFHASLSQETSDQDDRG